MAQISASWDDIRILLGRGICLNQRANHSEAAAHQAWQGLKDFFKTFKSTGEDREGGDDLINAAFSGRLP